MPCDTQHAVLVIVVCVKENLADKDATFIGNSATKQCRNAGFEDEPASGSADEPKQAAIT